VLFSIHHHFMASLGSNNFVLSLKAWIQKTDATSESSRKKTASFSSYSIARHELI
jgi:hypothetical protein